jgi:hypothetical protein
VPGSKNSPSPDISERSADSRPNFPGGAGLRVPMTFVLLLGDARTRSLRWSPVIVHYVESLSAPPHGLHSG